MGKSNSPRFEVDFKTRLEQQHKATNAVRLPQLGYAPYRVYEIKEKKGIKGIKENETLNGFYGYGTGGKSFYTKSKRSGSQQAIIYYMSLVDSLDFQRYEVRWLKPSETSLLMLRGHRVEPTTADDKSTIGSAKASV